jgi:hypothetical protein
MSHVIECPTCRTRTVYDALDIRKPARIKDITDECLTRKKLKETLYDIIQQAKVRDEKCSNEYEQGYIHGLEYALLLIKLEEFST